ncbi:hypothetical protein IAT38_006608 [Cryptococcus sp. DSM 104549]
MDVFVDDSSPQITYTSGTGGWISDHRIGTKFYDPMVGSYTDSTFHGTYTEGDQMKFAFNGSGIALFGAKRPNHGVFGAKVDDGDEMFVDTYAATSVYNQRLWALAGLSTSEEHIVIITNYPSKSDITSSVNQWWIDIDYLVFTHPVSGSLYITTIDDTSSAVSYGNGWAPYGSSNNVYFNRTDHASTTSNSAMELTFNGSSVQLFSGLGADHGQYSISLDGQPAEAFNATFFDTIYQVPVYTVTGLEDTVHTVRMTNLGSGAQSMLGFDYAVVNSSYDHSQGAASGSTQTAASVSSSPNFNTPSTAAGAGAANSSNSSNVAAIAGGAAGGAVGLALVLALAWFLFFRRRPTARPPSRVDSYYYPSDRSGYASSSRGYGPSPYPPSRRGLIDLVADKEAPGNSRSDTRSEWSSNGLQTPLTGGIDALPRLERGESQPFLLAVPSPPDSNASSYVIRGAPAAPSTASEYALDGPGSTYAAPAAAVAGSSRRPPPVPETTPSEYSQEGTYVSHPPAPLNPQHARTQSHSHSRVDSGAGVHDPLLGDARVLWGSRGKDAQRQQLTKLAREQAYVPGGQDHPPLRTPTEPHPDDSPHIRNHSQPLPRTPPRRPAGTGDTRSLQVTMLSPSGDSDAPLTSSEAAYKAELVKLPYTATPPRPGMGRNDSTEALLDLSLSLRGRRMEVPGRAIDMGPLPVHGHGQGGHEEEELDEGTGTLPPDYGAALRERILRGE